MADQIRLSVDARMIGHSGIGTVIRNLLPFLIADKRLDVTLLGDREKLSRFEWFDPARFIPVVSGIYGLSEQAELILKIPACDVFWSPHYNVPMLPIRARRRLVTVHDTFHLAYAHTLSLPKRAYSRLIMEGAVRLSDAIATVSEFSRGEILGRLKADARKLKVIPPGHDPDFTKGLGPAKRNGDYLLFVGNVKPHKNILGAMKAFMRISPRYPDLTFRIVGRKEGFITGDPEVARLAATLQGKVVFTGFVSDLEVKENYRDARALVFPSYYEGFGLPILEAMSFGIPVLSSRRASIPEVGGGAIRYFDPDDNEAFDRGLEDILEKRWVPDPAEYRDRLGMFSWKRSAAQYMELIESLI